MEAEGSSAPAISEAIRAQPWVHKPTRIDSAVDLTRPGLFADLHKLAMRMERKYRLQLNYAGAAVENRERGTTIYLGSRKSQVFLRIYEKGLQQAEYLGLDPATIPEDMLNWVRSELVFRPDKPPTKAWASMAAPDALWGVSTWSQDFAKVVFSIEAERVQMHQRRESNHERALRAMATQYRNHIDQLLRECGGDYAEAMAVLVDLAGLEEAHAPADA
jgi:DNA relaxase NicK